jgi:hypothetical protein
LAQTFCSTGAASAPASTSMLHTASPAWQVTAHIPASHRVPSPHTIPQPLQL